MQIKPHTFSDRIGVLMQNDRIAVVVLTGGGHIASVTTADNPINPLWVPRWPSLEPNVRALADAGTYGDHIESVMLSSIMGHNLCCDVFGAHSEGEAAIGFKYHGEAGMVHWSVESAQCDDRRATLVMLADLPHTALTIRRVFTLNAGSQTVRVDETMTNKVGFERALGVAQHATLGSQFLGSPDQPALFACNADRGMTWPEEFSQLPHSFVTDIEFDYPDIPSRDGAIQDWRRHPRHQVNGDLCSLRIKHADDIGWFSAYNPTHGLTIAYAWQRTHYPWLMTWEENHYRDAPPWNNKELTRGMEFTSYAFALSRKQNVALGEQLDTPCFTWLDAYEQRTSTFSFTVVDQGKGRSAAPSVKADENWQISLG